MTTTLAFKTPPGGAMLPPGEKTQDLGTVDVHAFDRIRVYAQQTIPTIAIPTISLYLMEGGQIIGTLGTLTVKGPITTVYEVPGTTLSISAEAPSPWGADASVEVWVWGAAN